MMSAPSLKRPAAGIEDRDAKRQRTDIVPPSGITTSPSAYEVIFQHFLGDKKITPETVQAKWEKTLQELNKAKQTIVELKQHESALVTRVAAREQEVQNLQAGIQEMRKAAQPQAATSRAVFVDPTLNILFKRMKDELDSVKQRLKQSQEDLSAATFTRESAAGRQLLNRIRLLQKENEELGQQLSEGQMHKLELEISMQRELAEELKQSLDESNEFVLQITEEMEKKFGVRSNVAANSHASMQNNANPSAGAATAGTGGDI